jgi:hypothetical protein
MNLIRNAFAASAVLLAVAVSAPASADTFNLNTNGGGGFVNVVPNGFHLFGDDSGVGGFTTYTATALSDQTFNFNWTYQSNDSDGPSYDPAGYVKNNVFTQLTDNGGASDQSGTFILSVLTGDIYGIYIDATDGGFGGSDILVTGLAASETPLPAALPLFASGLAGLGLLRWRRKKMAMAA